MKWCESRSRLIDLLVKKCRYVRDIAGLVATFVPTLGENVSFLFKDTEWPTISSSRDSGDDELFVIDQARWFKELEGYYNRAQRYRKDVILPLGRFYKHSHEVHRANYLKLAHKLESFVYNFNYTRQPINFLTPDVGITETRLSVLFDNTDMLNIIFSLPMSLADAYVRFNQRVALLIADVKTLAPHNKVINHLSTFANIYVASDQRNSKLYEALDGLLIHNKNYITHRMDKMFKNILKGTGIKNVYQLTAERITFHISTIWSYASENSKEAIWRALEDLLDLSNQIQTILHPPAPPAPPIVLTEDEQVRIAVDSSVSTL